MKPRNDAPKIGPNLPTCSHAHVALVPGTPPDAKCLERAARLFSALGDAQRLRVLHLLLAGEVCVSTIVATLGEKFSTISQRLRVLRSEGLVAHRREGSHVYYALADGHVKDLVSNALAHAEELDRPASNPIPEDERMSCTIHAQHDHQHGPKCGHTAIQHGDHVDYVHDGHLHHTTADGKVEEHTLPVSDANPASCTNGHACSAHAADHVHGPGCGHEAVPHGDHTCYIVDGHLHFQHNGHCDNHGPVSLVS